MTGQFHFPLPRNTDSVVALPPPSIARKRDRYSARGIEGRRPPDFLNMARRMTIKPDAPFVPARVTLIPGSARPGFMQQLTRNEEAIQFPNSVVS